MWETEIVISQDVSEVISFFSEPSKVCHLAITPCQASFTSAGLLHFTMNQYSQERQELRNSNGVPRDCASVCRCVCPCLCTVLSSVHRVSCERQHFPEPVGTNVQLCFKKTPPWGQVATLRCAARCLGGFGAVRLPLSECTSRSFILGFTNQWLHPSLCALWTDQVASSSFQGLFRSMSEAVSLHRELAATAAGVRTHTDVASPHGRVM